MSFDVMFFPVFAGSLCALLAKRVLFELLHDLWRRERRRNQ